MLSNDTVKRLISEKDAHVEWHDKNGRAVVDREILPGILARAESFQEALVLIRMHAVSQREAGKEPSAAYIIERVNKALGVKCAD